MPFQRGYVLGGSSSVSMYSSTLKKNHTHGFSDFMAFTRGSSDDYDRYARVTNDPGWSWQKIQKYIRMVRDFQYPDTRRN